MTYECSILSDPHTGWAGLLSKKNLQMASQRLRELCNLCNLLSTSQTPCIISACLVSLEIHQSIHIMTDSVKIEEKQSSRCQLSTPRDTSATHILVFPTSALAQQVMDSKEPNPNDSLLHQDPLATLGDAEDINILGGDGFLDMGDDDYGGLSALGIDDIFNQIMPEEKTSAPCSPQGGGRQSPSQMPMPHKPGQTPSISDVQEEAQALLQQPLAMGFYLSTAKPGPLPKWFWSACPQKEGLCPTCFKVRHYTSNTNL